MYAVPLSEVLELIEKADDNDDVPPAPLRNSPPGTPYYCDAVVLSIQDLFNDQLARRYRIVNVERRMCSRCGMRGDHTPGYCRHASCFNCDEMGHRADQCAFNDRVCTFCIRLRHIAAYDHLRYQCPRAPQGPRQHPPGGFREERGRVITAGRHGINVVPEMYTMQPRYTGAVDYGLMLVNNVPPAAERLEVVLSVPLCPHCDGPIPSGWFRIVRCPQHKRMAAAREDS